MQAVNAEASPLFGGLAARAVLAAQLAVADAAAGPRKGRRRDCDPVTLRRLRELQQWTGGTIEHVAIVLGVSALYVRYPRHSQAFASLVAVVHAMCCGPGPEVDLNDVIRWRFKEAAARLRPPHPR